MASQGLETGGWRRRSGDVFDRLQATLGDTSITTLRAIESKDLFTRVREA